MVAALPSTIKTSGRRRGRRSPSTSLQSGLHLVPASAETVAVTTNPLALGVLALSSLTARLPFMIAAPCASCSATYLPSHPSPHRRSPSLTGESANAATDTAHCETLKHPHSRAQVKQNAPLAFRTDKKNNKFAHPLNRTGRSRFASASASTCGGRLSPSHLISRASQGFCQRGCWTSHVRLSQRLSH